MWPEGPLRKQVLREILGGYTTGQKLVAFSVTALDFIIKSHQAPLHVFFFGSNPENFPHSMSENL